MSLFQRIKKSSLGQRLIGLSRMPVVGPWVRALARLAKSSEHRVARMRRANRAHDDRQKAALAAFIARRGAGK